MGLESVVGRSTPGSLSVEPVFEQSSMPVVAENDFYESFLSAFSREPLFLPEFLPLSLAVAPSSDVLNVPPLLSTESSGVAVPPRVSSVTAANSNAAQFEADVQNAYGVSSDEISQFTRAEFDRQLTEINALAQRIRPGAQHWTDALASLEQTRLQTPEQVMANFQQTVERTQTYLVENGLISPLRLPVVVEEDPTHVGSGAYALASKIVVETNNPDSDVYLPIFAPFAALHELVHVWDYQYNQFAENPHTEGAAFFLESYVLENGNFYSPEEELMGRKWQLLRQARAFLSVELQTGRMTPEEARLFLTENLNHDERYAAAEVQGMINDPIQKMSYAVGAAQIDQLWEQVQQTYPEISFRAFMDYLVAVGSDDTGNIVDYARERYGITLQGLSSTAD
ncbi:MAG: DUF885 family protein [Candidatus Melainabacteria bacterium]|nr:DUF885 family protein [Candidatus Melainabacteria bacterium]